MTEDASARIETMIALFLAEIEAHDPGENAEYCWWCHADINGKTGPKEPHDSTCWRVQVEALIAAKDTGAQP